MASPAEKTADMPSDHLSARKIQPELFPEEKLLWDGRPVQGIRLDRTVVFPMLLGALFLAIAIPLFLVAVSVIPLPHHLSPAAAGVRKACRGLVLYLVPIGLYFFILQNYLISYLCSRLFYGITNERILILREKWRGGLSVTSILIRDVPHLFLKMQPNGTGTMSFAGRTTNPRESVNFHFASFFCLPDVRKPYALIRSIQRAATFPTKP